jgi:Na+/glutamate symporter
MAQAVVTVALDTVGVQNGGHIGSPIDDILSHCRAAAQKQQRKDKNRKAQHEKSQ